MPEHWGRMLFIAFSVVALVQIFYYGWFFSRLAFYKPKKKQQSQQHPVSVIICARDEAGNIARNLPGVLAQNYSTTNELIVINDNSKDDSSYVLADLKKAFKKMRFIDLSQEAQLIKGKKYPLSVGIKEAKHEIVLLTDADCAPATAQWLFKMQDAFTDGIEVALGYGAYYRMPGLLNKLIRFETFHTALQYFSYALAGMPYMGVGRNLSYRKDLFFRNKGFSSINHIPSGDDDLFINQVATKHNTAIVIDPDAFTLSMPKTTWKEWWRQKERHYTTGRYYRSHHQFLLGLYSLSLFLFYPLFILSLIFFDWRWVLIPLIIRSIVQAIIFNKSMKKLNESDLFFWTLLFDIGMFVYYIIFAAALWRKPRKSWR